MQGLVWNPRARAPELFSDAQWAGGPCGTSAVPSVTQCPSPKGSVTSPGFKGLDSKSPSLSREREIQIPKISN